MSKTVLITGTLNGIGRGLMEHYHRAGWHVVAVNRRTDEEAQRQFPGVDFRVLNIEALDEVRALFGSLKTGARLPELIILNAGINLPDCLPGRFDFATFEKVMGVNLMGAMTFVAAGLECGLKGATLLAMSSTSNIVPNPAHLGYHLSKWAMSRSFKLLRKQDPHNRYKAVVLGPIRTNIMSGYPGPEGFQKRLLEFLSRDVKDLVPVVARFAEGNRRVLYYPVGVCLFYFAVKLALKLVPSLYSGTKNAEPVQGRT